MKRTLLSVLCCLLALFVLASCNTVGDISKDESAPEESPAETSRETLLLNLTDEELLDRVKGSWYGQACGVVWGADQEFWYVNSLQPENKVPDISTLSINGMFTQDDLYVEIPFMEALRANGVDCSLEKMAKAFANTSFGLDHANKQARENLQKGIPAPESGSYLNNWHCDDIDWQIESDFLGSMYPGMVDAGAARSFEIGHIMNYGDGCYGGAFVTAMHCAAFYADSVEEIIDAGISVIPENTKFRALMDDVMKWYGEGLTWEDNWKKLTEKWGPTKRCLSYSGTDANIDAKMNAGFILIGLLYGKGDFNESMKIAMRCGQDSDCNPSSVGAILGAYYGYSGIGEEWKQTEINGKFSYTTYTFDQIVALNVKLAEMAMEKAGCLHEDGKWIIAYAKEYKALPYEQWEDMPTLDISVTVEGGIAFLSRTAHDIGGDVETQWDMGDGNVLKGNASVYMYGKPGKYTVKCTVTNKNGNSFSRETEVEAGELLLPEDPEKGTYHNLAKSSVIFCSVTQPTGGGSKTLETIRDGVLIGGNTQQYDTYHGYFAAHEDQIGYLFGDEAEVDKVVFVEGMHYDNGGWFADGSMQLSVLTDDGWIVPDAQVSPAYPNGNRQSDFGAGYEKYTFTFPGIRCKGIMLSGTAGGSAGFIGVGELEVYGK